MKKTTALLRPTSNKLNAPKKEDQAPNSYLKYTSLSFQMMAAIGAGVWLGMRLDGYWQMDYPFFLCALALGSTMWTIFVVIKALV